MPHDIALTHAQIVALADWAEPGYGMADILIATFGDQGDVQVAQGDDRICISPMGLRFEPVAFEVIGSVMVDTND